MRMTTTTEYSKRIAIESTRNTIKLEPELLNKDVDVDGVDFFGHNIYKSKFGGLS